ncbi:MAG: DUF1588 domain-containing protein, partial [Myxococcaceae bacterium]|nr:DUF1588 domain-containing protein [Myxococcaceae bacterium]
MTLPPPRFAWPLSCALALTACTADIISPNPRVYDPAAGTWVGDPGAGGGGPGVATYDPHFSCDPSAAAPPAATPIKRLSKVHYTAALNEALAPLAAADRAALLDSVKGWLALVPEDTSLGDGLVTQAHVDATFSLAYALGTAVAASATYTNPLLASCGAGATRSSLSNATCLRSFVNAFGRRAFRRPLTAAETQDFVTFYGTLQADGLAGVLTRFLAHPLFFYPLDNEGQQRSGTEGVDATYQLDAYEQASRLTFFFWSSPPDDALLDAVPSLSAEQLVARVLDDARARRGVGDFYRHWLELDETPPLPSSVTPAFTAFAAGENVGAAGHNHREDMIREVVELGVHHTLVQPGRYEDLLTSPYAFAATADLARLYGTTAWNGDPSTLMPLPGGRRGLLTRAALVVSGSEITHPIFKGKRVRVQVLCDELAPPPPTLNITPLQPDVTQSQRQIVEQATAAQACQACHKQMNGLGFVTEGFDALGRTRTAEQKFDAQGAKVGEVAIDTTVTTAVVPGAQLTLAGPD